MQKEGRGFIFCIGPEKGVNNWGEGCARVLRRRLYSAGRNSQEQETIFRSLCSRMLPLESIFEAGVAVTHL